MSKNNTTYTEASSHEMVSKTSFARADGNTRQKAATVLQTVLQTSSEITELRNDINSMTHSTNQAQQSFLENSKRSTRQAKRVFARVLKKLNGDYSTALKRHLRLTVYPTWTLLALASFSIPLLFQTSQSHHKATADLAISRQFLSKTESKMIQMRKDLEKKEAAQVQAEANYKQLQTLIEEQIKPYIRSQDGKLYGYTPLGWKELTIPTAK